MINRHQRFIGFSDLLKLPHLNLMISLYTINFSAVDKAYNPLDNSCYPEKNNIRIDLVRGGKNKEWDIDILRKLEGIQSEYPNKFALHVLPKAGHWVHVDDLGGLINLFETHNNIPLLDK